MKPTASISTKTIRTADARSSPDSKLGEKKKKEEENIGTRKNEQRAQAQNIHLNTSVRAHQQLDLAPKFSIRNFNDHPIDNAKV